MARKYFGDQDPIGKTVTASGVLLGATVAESHLLTVTGVLQDLPHNTHLIAGVVLPNSSMADQIPQSEKDNWWDINSFGYVSLLPNADPRAVLTKLNPILDRTLNPEQALGLKLRSSQILEVRLTPFTEAHLTSDNYGALKPGGSLTTVYGSAVIAILIILVACFNFTNLATARATLRARGIALRKAVGAKRWQLIGQFLSEAILTVMIALGVALALIEILLPVYSGFLNRPIEFHYLADWPLLMCLVAATIATGLLSGVYPAIVLSSYRPAIMLRANFADTRTGSGRVRVLLVISQFAVCIGLGIGTLVTFSQISFVSNVDLGFIREGIVVVIGGRNLTSSARDSFMHALTTNPDIVGVASSNQLPLAGSSNAMAAKPGDPNFLIRTLDITPEFPDVFGIRLIAGRNLSRDRGEDMLSGNLYVAAPGSAANEGRNILVNLSAARRFGYTGQEAIGKTVIVAGSHVTIAGVLSDANLDGIRAVVQPMVYGYYPADNSIFVIRIRGERTSATLAFIDRTWRDFVPAVPIQRHFLNDTFASQFEADARQGTMFGLFVGIAIFIACLGLFGLAAFTAQRRTKEIGIRKVFGARTVNIVQLLLWQFSIPVLVANVIAWPVAYYYLHRWLDTYTYRISLNPLYFLTAGTVALLIASVTVSAHAFRVARESPIHALRYE
jgi:putative ABC transport system permease protein